MLSHTKNVLQFMAAADWKRAEREEGLFLFFGDVWPSAESISYKF